MALFQQTVLKKHIESLNTAVINEKWNLFQSHFQNAVIQQNIRKLKEEQYQGEFLDDLFVKIFGYTKAPSANFNLITEQKNITNSKKADGAIIVNDKALAVIELKGTDTTDLAKIETQAFGYKSNQPGCNYVITSNFEKLRFYIDNTTQFEEFNLFTMNKSTFELLYCCLDWESISNNVPTNLLNQSVSKENAITKQLYNDYSAFKRGLFDNLVELNPQHDKLELFKKTQKLLDRFLFIFFAEDRLLLPTNLIRRINKEWENLQKMRMTVSLYDRYVVYFHDLNDGAKVTLPAFGKKTGEAIEETHEIFAYNGGLFKPDEFLDNLKIDDQLLFSYTHKLSDYDFQSEVDVNILGHIFENSLNEIDEIKSEIEGVVVDKTKTKRKKDGVFYTPKYITKYIVDNTIGKLCAEKKAEIKLIEEEYHTEKNLQTKTKKALLDKLSEYRSWLLQLTICDPACGSGAFLNQALEFLIAEHRYIDELQAKLMGDSMILSDVETSILENNIYGVDLNDESIEIAKLSLWLRTAQKGRKLNSLNNNIKCGNSLVDDVEVAGEKAFSWEKEFPDVFEKGGFDVIIGNPPYLRVQGLRENFIKESMFYENNFKSATGRFDVYVLFLEHSFELINKDGIVSFILPHKFLITDFGIGIRKYFIENNAVESIVHFGSEIVFTDASTYTCIINLSQGNNGLLYKQIKPQEIFDSNKFEFIKFKDLSSENWNLNNKNNQTLIDKICKQPLKVKDIFKNISQGVVSVGDDIFIMKGKIIGNRFIGFSEKINQEINIESEIVKPLLKGENVRRYSPITQEYFIFYPHININNKTIPIEEEFFKKNYPLAYNYILPFKNELIEKKIRYKTNPTAWYSLHRSREIGLFEQEKIVTPETSLGGNMTIDYSSNYHNTQVYTLELKPNNKIDKKFIISILNSKLFWFYLQSTGAVLRGGYFRFKTKYLEPFPIPKINTLEIQKPIILKVDQILILNIEFHSTKTKFTSYFSKQYQIEKLSGKLQKWYELEFQDFIKELNKAIKTVKGTPLTKKDEFEWIDLFEENKQKALSLKAEIDKTDKEIDQMVYALYELTEEEIRIVEGC
jgi:type I restriction-modification system DNA methylase subunit